MKKYTASVLAIVVAMFVFIIIGGNSHYGEDIPLHSGYSFAVKYFANYTMINSKGELLTEPQHEDAREFSEGLAAVKKKGKWGYIDRDGNVVIDYQFDEVRNFHCGRAVVISYGEKGADTVFVIDRNGKTVVKPGVFEDIKDFSSSRACFLGDENGLNGYIDIDGDVVISGNYSCLTAFSEDVACVQMSDSSRSYAIDLHGKKLFEFPFAYFCDEECPYNDEVRMFDGKIPVQVSEINDTGASWQFWGKDGKPAIDKTFSGWVSSYSEGYAVFLKPGKGYEIVDSKGKVLHSSNEAVFVSPFHNGVTAYKQNLEESKWGYMHPDGSVLFPAILSEANDFNDGFAWIHLEGKIGTRILTKSGTFLPCPLCYSNSNSIELEPAGYRDKVCYPCFSEGRGFVSVSSNAIVSSLRPKKFMGFVRNCDGFSEGLINNNDSRTDFCHFNEHGKAIVRAPFEDRYVYPFKEGRAVVTTGEGNLSFINLSGELTGGVYSRSSMFFSQGRLIVGMEGNGDTIEYGVVDLDGKIVIPCKYHSISPCYIKGFVHARETKDSESIILNREGKVATEEELSRIQASKAIRDKYFWVGYYAEDLAAFQLDKDGKYGFINPHGKVVIEPQYDCVFETMDDFSGCFESGFCVAVKDDKCGVIDKKGNVVVPFIYDEIGLDGDWLPQRTVFQGDYCAVKKDGKWGFVDRSGKEVIAPQYDSVVDYNDDIAIVGNHPVWLEDDSNLIYGVIHIKDKSELLPFQYSEILWKLR